MFKKLPRQQICHKDQLFTVNASASILPTLHLRVIIWVLQTIDFVCLKKTNKKINFLFSLDELLLNNLKLLSFSTFLILLKVKENKRLQLLAWVYSQSNYAFQWSFWITENCCQLKKKKKNSKSDFTLLFSPCSPAAKWKYQKCLLLTTKYIVLDRLISLEDEWSNL